jgi:hypothetical protein
MGPLLCFAPKYLPVGNTATYLFWAILFSNLSDAELLEKAILGSC